ncbi:MAG: hypothetical protein ABIK62_02545 [candidate division WOR-3 bacterium]
MLTSIAPSPRTTGLSACLLFVFASCSEDKDMVRDSAALDRQMIPIMAMCGEGRIRDARQAISALNSEWSLFVTTYRNYKPGDSLWRPGFAHMDSLMNEANRFLSAEGALTRVLMRLRAVRAMLTQLRQRHGISYYLDLLDAFAEPLESLTRPALDPLMPVLSDSVVAQMQAQIPLVQERWQAVLNARFEPGRYGFTARRNSERDSLLRAETRALEHLSSTLASGTRSEIAAAAEKAWYGCVALDNLFGNFEEKL